MKNRIIPVILTAAATSLLTLFIAAKILPGSGIVSDKKDNSELPVNYARYTGNNIVASTPPADFQPAAEASVQAVVHIKTKTNGKEIVFKRQSFWGDFYERGFMPPQMGAGSGVVISPKGYIITNNHVVANADDVTVTFNNRFTTDAKVIATDPSTDIAVLKVLNYDDKELPYMEFGNSDDVQLGQWVLAVGYPLTLDATVTAGIVSAKGRSLGINRTQSATAVESFIQTDAAVNPGNSGGALVNTKGQLIGINSAIASPTGSYAGYSYAIPSNLVKKVVDDIIEFGTVQRAFLGIAYKDIKMLSIEEIRDLGIDKQDGVYISKIMEGGAAEKAGLKEGDFITAINGMQINSSPELLEQIARFRPGDNVSVTYVRSGKPIHTTVQLKNIEGNTKIIKSNMPAKMLGANLISLSKEEISKYNVNGGVKVSNIENGIISQQTSMKNGFIITKANGTAVNNVQELQNLFAANSGKIELAGFYPDRNGVYYYGINLD